MNTILQHRLERLHLIEHRLERLERLHQVALLRRIFLRWKNVIILEGLVRDGHIEAHGTLGVQRPRAQFPSMGTDDGSSD